MQKFVLVIGLAVLVQIASAQYQNQNYGNQQYNNDYYQPSYYQPDQGYDGYGGGYYPPQQGGGYPQQQGGGYPPQQGGGYPGQQQYQPRPQYTPQRQRFTQADIQDKRRIETIDDRDTRSKINQQEFY